MTCDFKQLYLEKGRRRRKEWDGEHCKWHYRMCAMYVANVHHSKIYWGHFSLHVHYQLENHSWIIFFLLKTVENSHRANISILCPNPKREIVSTNELDYKLRYNVIWMCVKMDNVNNEHKLQNKCFALSFACLSAVEKEKSIPENVPIENGKRNILTKHNMTMALCFKLIFTHKNSTNCMQTPHNV